MKVTKENIKDINFIADYFNIDTGKSLLDSLLIDLLELNTELENKGEKHRQLYIDYEDQHTKYSSERIDPCPDNYGYFTLRFEKNPYETVGGIFSLNELDTVLCALINFEEARLS